MLSDDNEIIKKLRNLPEQKMYEIMQEVTYLVDKNREKMRPEQIQLYERIEVALLQACQLYDISKGMEHRLALAEYENKFLRDQLLSTTKELNRYVTIEEMCAHQTLDMYKAVLTEKMNLIKKINTEHG